MDWDAVPAPVLDAAQHARAFSPARRSTRSRPRSPRPSSCTRGEIRFAIETALEPRELWRGKTPRQRALEVFAALGVWDTAANNGVLIYVLLADRDVEIVADRGYNRRVASRRVGRRSATRWSALFQAGDYGAGRGRRRAPRGEIMLATHFPPLPGGRDEDELPNRPAHAVSGAGRSRREVR